MLHHRYWKRVTKLLLKPPHPHPCSGETAGGHLDSTFILFELKKAITKNNKLHQGKMESVIVGLPSWTTAN